MQVVITLCRPGWTSSNLCTQQTKHLYHANNSSSNVEELKYIKFMHTPANCQLSYSCLIFLIRMLRADSIIVTMEKKKWGNSKTCVKSKSWITLHTAWWEFFFFCLYIFLSIYLFSILRFFFPIFFSPFFTHFIN